MVIATDKFSALAQQSGQQAGLDGARIVSVDHPVGGVSKEELRRRADAVVEEVMNRLLGR